MQRRLAYGIVALVLAGAALGWAFAPAPVAVEWAAVSIGPFETTVEDDAITRLRDAYVVSAPLAGRLERIVLREGDRVRAGALVAVIRPALAPLLDARTQREQQARVQAASAQVRAAQAQRERADSALRLAHLDAARAARLADQGYVSASHLDAEQTKEAAARKDYESAAARHQVAQQELAMAQAALETVVPSAAKDSPPFKVLAPIDGEVLRTSEQVVGLGTPLLELGNRGEIEVVADLLTSSAVLCRPGSPVRIEQWGGPPLRGRVRRIEPAGFTKISALGVEEQRVNVLIDLLDEQAKSVLGVGYGVSVRITTLSMARVRKVPLSAVFPLPSAGPARHAVYVIRDGQADLVPVEVAGRNETEAWLRDGPRDGTPVIVYPGAEVADGVRVRQREVARAR